MLSDFKKAEMHKPACLLEAGSAEVVSQSAGPAYPAPATKTSTFFGNVLCMIVPSTGFQGISCSCCIALVATKIFKLSSNMRTTLKAAVHVAGEGEVDLKMKGTRMQEMPLGRLTGAI